MSWLDFWTPIVKQKGLFQALASCFHEDLSKIYIPQWRWIAIQNELFCPCEMRISALTRSHWCYFRVSLHKCDSSPFFSGHFILSLIPRRALIKSFDSKPLFTMIAMATAICHLQRLSPVNFAHWGYSCRNCRQILPDLAIICQG